jgi:outer membrane lipoprotein-sorting protein
MLKEKARNLFFVLLMFAPAVSEAQDIKSYLENLFTGYAYQFGYGSGTSSSNPRVELVIHYCASKTYFSHGQSCRPNLYASGYQCSNIQDSGVWQIDVQNGQGVIQWMSNTSGPGSLMLFIRNDGSVVDQQGNPFQRVGIAQCG